MSPAEAAGDVGTGLALLAAGGAVWARVRDSGTGPLLVLAGVTWLAGDVTGSLVHAHRGPLVHALLTFPTGRARSKPVVVVIAAAYVDGLVPAAAREPWTTLGLAAIVVGAAVWRPLPRGATRRSHRVSVACSVAVVAPLVLVSIGRLTRSEVDVPAAWFYQGAVVLTAVALATELLTSRSVKAAATGLVVHLAAHQEPQALRDALARAVGDPELEIAYRVDDPGAEEHWVDEAGQPVRLPVAEHSEGRLVTLVEDAGSPVAALVHDSTVLRDETLAQSVSAAVRLVLTNVRLQAEDAARTREVSASRRRLVEAGDEERRRIGEQLRDGAERMLAEVSAGLAAVATDRTRPATTAVLGIVDELGAAAADLARFAQGVHPVVLTEHGLTTALRDLAGQAAVAVDVRTPPGRFPAPQEAAVYFVCSEALANVAKYAEATRASIEVTRTAHGLDVRVTDDGRGGADPGRGSGLRGLRDRVEALGGRLEVLSPPGAGTRLEAELPLARDAP